MPAIGCPDRPAVGAGMPSRGRSAPRYHEHMATAVFSRAPGQRTLPAPACARLGFRLAGSVLDLDVRDTAALELLQTAYAPLQCPAAGARVHASLQRLADGRLHVRYGRQTLRFANAADPVPLRAAYHAAREIFARFACERHDAIALYGTLCAVDNAAVLLLGPTTIGKTLLALHVAAAGAQFLGDETVLLSPKTAEAHAMPRRPSLRESALALLPQPSMREAVEASAAYFETDRGRFWYGLDALALGIEPSERPLVLRAVCVLRERGDRAAVDRVDRDRGLKVLAQRAYVRPTSLAQIAALRAATRRAAFFEITLGAPDATSAALLHQVRACE